MTEDSHPIRADVPLDLHPDTLAPYAAALDRDGTGGRGALAAGREALSAFYGMYAAMQDAERELRALAAPARRREHPGGRTETVGDVRMERGVGLRQMHGHEEEYAAACEQAFYRAAKIADRRMAELKTNFAAVEQRINDALDHPPGRSTVGVSQAGEIRSLLRALPRAERSRLIGDAIKGDDKQTLAAVLQAPPYLSGITDAERAAFRTAAAEKWAREDHAAHAALDRMIEAVMRAGTIALDRHLAAQERGQNGPAKAGKVLSALART